MLEKIRLTIAAWLFKRELDGILLRQKQLDAEVGKRVADVLAQMDPFEPLMRAMRGIFSSEFEHPEQKLDPKSWLGFTMWAYQQKNDPHFNFLMDWIIDTQANATLKRGNPTPDAILYGRAQISAPILIKKEVSRLASVYEEYLRKQKGEEFDAELTVE